MILLDTDVLIDVALDRRPHSGPASELFDRVEHGARRAFVAWHIVTRNVRDFANSPIPAMTPREALAQLF